MKQMGLQDTQEKQETQSKYSSENVLGHLGVHGRRLLKRY